MKNQFKLITICLLLSSLALSARAQGTAFTYQGRLTDSGAPANGSYVFRFSLDNGNNTPVGSPIVVSPVAVTNGLFTVALDFGPGIFTNATRNLNIQVHTNDNGSSFVQLSPSQPILPTPYAIYAETADAAGIIGVVPAASLSGTYGNAMTVTNGNNTFAGNGAGLTGVDAAKLGGLAASNFWQTTGNAGTTAGPNFLGTTDNQPLELRANGQRVLRLDSSGSVPNIIGGHAANSMAPGLSGVTIAGGGDAASFNSVNSSWGTVSGGSGNTIAASAAAGTISGGANNLVANSAGLSTINGGFGNIVSATYGAIAGGEQNWIKPLADHSIIGGGYFNTNSGSYATIGGGAFNGVQANALNGTIGGGQNNSVASPHGVVAGGEGNEVGANSDHATIGGGFANTVQAIDGTIGGGFDNMIQIDALYSTISGGVGNTIQTGAWYATIGGGNGNTIQTNTTAVTIGGGYQNKIQTTTKAATISGGEVNTIQTNADDSTIGGGSFNTISSNSPHSTIGGGFANQAAGTDVVVAGGTNNQANAAFSVVGGGQGNKNSGMAAVIGGGWNNLIETTTNTLSLGLGVVSVIAAGENNSIGQGSTGSTISGGGWNTIMALNQFSTIGGGKGNTIEEMGGYFTNGGFVTAGSHVISGGQDNRIGSFGDFSAIAGGWENSVKSNVNIAAIGGGSRNSVETNADFATIPGGDGAVARSSGQFVHAGGVFASSGDAQTSVYVLHGVTTNATLTEIFLAPSLSLSFGGSLTNRMKVPPNGFWSFDVLIAATTSGNLQVAGYQIKGMVVRNGLGTAIVGMPDKTTLNGSTLSWAADVSAGSADGTLQIIVTGAASTTIRWVASVRTTEVVF